MRLLFWLVLAATMVGAFFRRSAATLRAAAVAADPDLPVGADAPGNLCDYVAGKAALAGIRIV
jgi:hypothetical protein